jgi:ferric-dicitrate binding protein FerR (iron transport regulator)
MNSCDPKLIRQIVARFHSSRSSGKTVRYFHKWLLSSEDYTVKDEAMHEVWDSMDSTVTASTYKSLELVKVRLGMIPPKKSTTSLRRTLLRVAAVLLPAVLVIGTYFGIREFNNNVKWARVETPYGKTEQYTLADGTTVWLNAGSSLEYPVRFRGEQREVKLRGEGFFKVTPNEHKPFVVISNHLRTTVLGTEFNVKAYDNQRNESVTVLSGEVNVVCAGGDIHHLTPNNHLTYWTEGGDTEIVDEDAASIMGWVSDGLVFENSTIEDILCGIQRKYSDLKVVVDSTKLTNTVYRMQFTHDESLEHVLDVVHKVTGIEYTLNGDTLIIGEE